MRQTMTALVGIVARLVNDADHSIWTQDAIQQALDFHRAEARYLELDPIPTRAPSGTTYLTYEAPHTHWEEGASFYQGNYETLDAPDTPDYLAGRWAWSTEPTRPVRLLGYTYDVYAAAADLLEERAAQKAEDLASFSLPHGTVAFAGKTANWLRLARLYRARARSEMITLRRSDLRGEGDA